VPRAALSRTRARLTQAQAAALFSKGAAAFVVITINCQLAWGVLWTDVLGDNPRRSLLHAVFVDLPLKTVGGSLWTIVNSLLALVASGLVAALAAKRFGMVPFWVVLALLPISLGLIHLQDALTPTASFFLDPPFEVAAWDRVWARWLYAMAPALLLCWAAQHVWYGIEV
jgi:hypothetical protein